MKLVAIYLIENTLPRVLGEDHEGVMLNLGGKYLYTITGKFEDNSINILRRLNDSYFENTLWGENISSINTLVGANGVGKSTILKNILNRRNTIDIYEFEDDKVAYKIHSQYEDYAIDINSDNKSWLTDLEIETYSKPYLNRLYYSPLLDYELSDINSPINLSSYRSKSIEEYFFKSLERQVNFLSNEELVNRISDIYNDFPFFESIELSLKRYSLNDFLKVYEGTSVGGKTDINKVQGFLETPKSMYDSKGINYNLERLWDLEDYKGFKEDNYTINDDNQIKYFELIILSMCFLDDTFGMFPETGDEIQIEEVLNANTFEDRLNLFFKKRICNTNIFYHKELKELGEFYTLSSSDLILRQIDNYRIKNANEDFNGKNIIRSIVDVYGTIYNFYKVLTEYSTKESLSFLFDTENVKKLFTLLSEYKMFSEKMSGLVKIVKVFDFHPSKLLSSGEKSILDFYSSLNWYLHNQSLKGTIDKLNNVNLLLDEPELGYHPLWKKKFIHAINTTLPVLFKHYWGEDFTLHIIFTTHDPLTLSDIPKQNIIYLKKNKETKLTKVLSENEKANMKSFGANIHDLLSDSFFIDDGLIGDFAKSKIKEVINWINGNEKISEIKKETEYFREELAKYEKIIELIDDKVIKLKLAEMISDLTSKDDIYNKVIDNEIEFLKRKKRRL